MSSILIVEDEEFTRELLVSILTKQFPDVALYSAINGRTGLELCKTHSPDIVITDMNMPEMGGVTIGWQENCNPVELKVNGKAFDELYSLLNV